MREENHANNEGGDQAKTGTQKDSGTKTQSPVPKQSRVSNESVLNMTFGKSFQSPPV